MTPPKDKSINLKSQSKRREHDSNGSDNEDPFKQCEAIIREEDEESHSKQSVRRTTSSQEGAKYTHHDDEYLRRRKKSDNSAVNRVNSVDNSDNRYEDGILSPSSQSQSLFRGAKNGLVTGNDNESQKMHGGVMSPIHDHNDLNSSRRLMSHSIKRVESQPMSI